MVQEALRTIPFPEKKEIADEHLYIYETIKKIAKDFHSTVDGGHNKSQALKRAYKTLKLLHDNIGNLKGKKVLDIGAGSSDIDEYIKDTHSRTGRYMLDVNRRHWEPWVSRILSEIGADVLAIDKGDLRGNNFRYENINIAEDPDFIDRFDDGEFDAIIMRNLQNSPTFVRTTSEAGGIRADIFEKIFNTAKKKINHRGVVMKGSEVYGRTSI